MGQKVHPNGIRLGIVKKWQSRWYVSKKDFADTLRKDYQARCFVESSLAQAGVNEVRIDRPARNAKVVISTARPGMIIGKKGKDVEYLREEITRIMGVPAHVSIEEIRKPELCAKLVAESIAQQLEKRVMFRRAMKRAVASAMRSGALGIKTIVSGRLGGTEIARNEKCREGRVPLHTFRADIDYGFAEANTTYGIIGVKVWIFKGEVLTKEEVQTQPAPVESAVKERFRHASAHPVAGAKKAKVAAVSSAKVEIKQKLSSTTVDTLEIKKAAVKKRQPKAALKTKDSTEKKVTSEKKPAQAKKIKVEMTTSNESSEKKSEE